MFNLTDSIFRNTAFMSIFAFEISIFLFRCPQLYLKSAYFLSKPLDRLPCLPHVSLISLSKIISSDALLYQSISLIHQVFYFTL